MCIKNRLNKLEFTTKNELTTAEITHTHTHTYTSACCIYLHWLPKVLAEKKAGRKKKLCIKSRLVYNPCIWRHKIHQSERVFRLFRTCSLAKCCGLVCCKRLCSISQCSTRIGTIGGWNHLEIMCRRPQMSSSGSKPRVLPRHATT